MRFSSALRPAARIRPLALAALFFAIAAHGQTPSSPALVQRLSLDELLSDEVTAITARTFSMLAALGGAFAGNGFVQVAASPANETEVKAALLYHLTQFVDWPPSSFDSPLDPLIIGVLGSDPFGDYLDEFARHQAAGTRRIVVVRFRDARAARQAHVLFVSPSEHEHLQAIFAALEGRPILTVSDVDSFLRRGGIIRFYRNAENKIRVRINLEAARATGLTISAKLLRVVEIVPPEEE